MALKVQTDRELVLPDGWDQSEQLIISSFFEQRVPKIAKTTCSASECHLFAKSLMQEEEITLVNNQGYHSYTLACPKSNQIIQFRLKELNMEFMSEAANIHGVLVSKVAHHSGFKLPVYTVDMVPGVAHYWQEPSRDHFPLERELRTVKDLAKFIAASSHLPHPPVDCKDTSRTHRARATFDRLEHNMSLKEIAPDLHAEVVSVSAKLMFTKSNYQISGGLIWTRNLMFLSPNPRTSAVVTMNLYFLMLASLASAVNTTPSLVSPGVNANNTLSLPALDYAYRCASPAQHEAGRHTPTTLDCLNVLTFMLATTPNHDRLIEWSRNPVSGQTPLPYRRSSGSCQLNVQLTHDRPGPTTETASFDEVIGAAMRITEVCLLSRPDIEHWGGAAVVGLSRFLDVVVWGTPMSGGNEGVQSNETLELTESGGWITATS